MNLPNRTHLAVLTLAAALIGTGDAQTFGVAFSYSDARFEPEVQLRELPVGGALLDFRVANGLTEPLELGGAARFRTSFGVLGTVSAAAHADLSSAGAFDVGLDGSGALAATGLDAEVAVFNRNPGAFAPSAAYALRSRPFFPASTLEPGVGAHLRAGVTQRLGRTLLLEAAPEVTLLSGTGVGAGLDLRLQFRRLVDSDNGVALLEASTGPGAGRGFVAGGAEYQLNRRGLPSLTAALLLGSGPSGFAPGVRATASGEIARFSYRAEVAAEPYRATTPPYRANLAAGTALGPGALGLEVGAALANDFGVPPLLLRGSYAFRF